MDTYDEHYLEVVSDPRFKLMGLTVKEIMEVKKTMDKWATHDVRDVLKPDPV